MFLLVKETVSTEIETLSRKYILGVGSKHLKKLRANKDVESKILFHLFLVSLCAITIAYLVHSFHNRPHGRITGSVDCFAIISWSPGRTVDVNKVGLMTHRVRFY